jgi:hypothetical protein
MQLLTLGFLNTLLAALTVAGFFALVATTGLWLLRPARTNIYLAFLAVLTFGLLGFVTGKILGNSREAAVGTVVPAVLTLLGSVSIYVIGVKGTRAQGPVSAMVLCFTICLLAGSHFGAQLRYDYEVFISDPGRVAERDLLLEQKRLGLDLQRLLNYLELLKTRQSLQEVSKIDLSKFQSAFERLSEDKSLSEGSSKK